MADAIKYARLAKEIKRRKIMWMFSTNFDFISRRKFLSFLNSNRALFIEAKVSFDLDDKYPKIFYYNFNLDNLNLIGQSHFDGYFVLRYNIVYRSGKRSNSVSISAI